MALVRKVNLLAVGICGLSAFALSLLWYSPLLWGGIWMRYRKPQDPSMPRWTAFFAPLRELIAAYVLALLIVRLNLKDLLSVFWLMLLLWIAFHAVGMAGAILWDHMPWQLGAVHAGDWLMKMLFLGITLTLWQRRRPPASVNLFD